MSALSDAQAALKAYDDVPGKGVDRSGWTRDDRDFAREQQRAHFIRTAPRVVDTLRALLSATTEPPTADATIVDCVAQAMCSVEARSKGATLEEVQTGIQRWTRHRYEAERMVEELRDYGLEVRRPSPPTDAEVNAVALELWGVSAPYDREKLRAALEAGRQAAAQVGGAA
ncbi:MAG: hypothetical protein K0Q52_105 [Microbacterium sp.]|nr:hypothetical protein [Microbacterium sp.]